MSGPEISVVLATTDHAVAVSPLAAYRRQSVADRLEVVVVAPAGELAKFDPAACPELHSLRRVEAPQPFALAAARAAGALAASAPWVFVGETHSFAHPRLAERLLAAAAGSPAEPRAHCFVPSITNANPDGAVSVASLVVDYGAWGPAHREVQRPPIYNALFAREMLAEHAATLTAAMSPSDDTVFPMPADGRHRAVRVPEATIDHLNVVRLSDFARTKCWFGMLVGDVRARRWPWPRRLLYAAAAPAIAAVLFRRYVRDHRIEWSAGRPPRGVVPLLALGAVARAAGESIGYLGWMPRGNERRLEHLEIHKRDYVPGWPR